MLFPKYFTPKRIVQGVGNFLKIQHVDVIQYSKNRIIAYLVFMKSYLILDCNGSEKRLILMSYLSHHTLLSYF
jgi:hypothetical protein